jgi:hypothetical protein
VFIKHEGDKMDAVLVFIDGTICDTRRRNHLFGSPDFYSDENIMNDTPTKGSIGCMKELSNKYTLIYIGARPKKYRNITKEWLKKSGFPEGAVYLGQTIEERLNIVKELKERYSFRVGIGDRWDDNELHLVLGCMSIILKEYEPNWDTVRKYVK